MNDNQKKQINDAIELMKSICDNTKSCDIMCPLWPICCEHIFRWNRLS